MSGIEVLMEYWCPWTQAKVSELEQQVDELTQRISLLTSEKANLDSRVNILVRVLRMRDDEIVQLQQKLKVRRM